MLFGGKSTFKELSESTEKIASNILSSRLKLLERHKMVTKNKVPGNDKVVVYRLTDKGTSLAPVIVELIAWSDKNIREFNPDMISRDSELMTAVQSDKMQFAEYIQKRY
jgi:DNA-binding HxlR family transcriptional regulator